jgi:GH25 family lysozyme M1 (1,4-beta-N-acetylmuramidase)
MTTWLKTNHDIVGPDVSVYQDVVDWATMAARQTNMGFAMCKATQGTTHVDSKFKTNILAMSKHLSTTSRTFPPPTSPPTTSPYTHPIAIGVYHFANIIPGQTDADYAQQADFFFNTASTVLIPSKIKNVPPTFVNPDFWVLDWEDARGHSLSVTERAKFAKTFVTRLYNNLKSKYGSSYVPKIFIYVGYYYWGNPDVSVVGNVYEWFGSYGPKLWIAAYVTNNVLPPAQSDWDVVYNDPTLNVPHFAPPHPPHPPPPPTWSAWQYTSSARVPGVSGRCDVSVVLSPEVWNSDFYQPP